MNEINSFIYSLNCYFVGKNNIDCIQNNLIRKNTEKLSVNGDFVFPINFSIWKNFINNNKNVKDVNNIFIYKLQMICTDEIDTIQNDNEIHNEINKFIKTSENWIFHILKAYITEKDHKCRIFLDRTFVFTKMLPLILETANYGCMSRVNKSSIKITSVVDSNINSNQSPNITEYRAKLITDVLKKLVEYSKYTITIDNEADENDHAFTVFISYKSTCNNLRKAENINIYCGIVVTAEDHRFGNSKLANISATEYINQRTTDMQLIAQHRYGLRTQHNKEFFDTIKCRGIAATAIDLLEVKHSSPVLLKIGSNHIGCSKGASFILYNSARIETLLKTFDQKVNNGDYSKLPPIENIDISLLKEEEEWQLLFVYVLGFPTLIERTIGNLQQGQIAPHLICTFLSGFVHLFSVYYRRVHILTEPRPHLLPVLFARIYFLKCIRLVLNKCMALLNIDPVTEM